jgi:hypothetical protein
MLERAELTHKPQTNTKGEGVNKNHNAELFEMAKMKQKAEKERKEE